MTRTDQMESLRLQAAIASIENRLFNSGALERSSASMLAKMLNDAKHELNSVEASIKQHHDEGQRKAQAEVAAVVYLVARETALNEQERELYGEFIARDFFTKEDFDNLDKFYTHTWDRLSESGKSEMSQRVWGGVKRGEYEFVELPDVVKEKEAARLERILKMGPSQSSSVWWVPEADRIDFSKAREAGRREESYEVLNRPSFAGALGSKDVGQIAAVAAVKDEDDRRAIASATGRDDGKAEARSEKPKIIDNGSFDLDDLGTFKDPLNHNKAGLAATPQNTTDTPHH